MSCFMCEVGATRRALSALAAVVLDVGEQALLTLAAANELGFDHVARTICDRHKPIVLTAICAIALADAE